MISRRAGFQIRFQTFFQTGFRRFGFQYLLTLLLILGVKYWYGSAGSEQLEWILRPTARWVEAISGIPFEKAPQNGYVNHVLRVVIAPSCSGVRFLLIAFSCLVFPFLYRFGTAGKGWGWMTCSAVAAYFYTIWTNGVRIALAVYLPSLLGRGRSLFHGWITPERLHTFIGTAVYFASLLLLYRGAEAVFRRINSGKGNSAKEDFGKEASRKEASRKEASRKETSGKEASESCLSSPVPWYLPPVVCYFAMALGIPFLRRLCRNDWDGFPGYALLVTLTCMLILFGFGLAGAWRRRTR